MRSRNKLLIVAGMAALAAAIPALGQDAPESILPPGFGDPEPPPRPTETPSRPSDLVPNVGLNVPDAPASGDALAAADQNAEGEADEGELPEEMPLLVDLPAQARRSLATVGVLGPEDGDMGATAFGNADGRYLAHLMRETRAPIASRWASILLRRALLSTVDTPRGISGADWVAERAWLLLRMGEADAARMLVQSVDADRYSPKLQDVALQAALATADPAAGCAFIEGVPASRREQAWPMMRAICAALAGESAQASSLIDRARGTPVGRGIDGILAEKVVGAGVNTRRSVTVEWDGVDRLTAWRFGMASATAVEIPDKLFATVGPHVRAWQARAPLLNPVQRQKAADTAAALGVMSSSALVDFYGQVGELTDPTETAGKSFVTLRNAYAGEDASARLSAMRTLWDGGGEDAAAHYARLILTARAAAMVKPNQEALGDVDQLIAAMLSAGLDIQAARWAPLIEDADGAIRSRSWGLLAVGAPGRAVPWNQSEAAAYADEAGSDPRGAFLFAGMAGLGRLSNTEISDMAADLGVPVGRENAWTRALDRAVTARQPATVALLCGLGLQGGEIQKVSPATLYRAVSALRRVGLAAEARMIAAEALMRG
jgi:hypothetical protein